METVCCDIAVTEILDNGRHCLTDSPCILEETNLSSIELTQRHFGCNIHDMNFANIWLDRVH